VNLTLLSKHEKTDYREQINLTLVATHYLFERIKSWLVSSNTYVEHTGRNIVINITNADDIYGPISGTISICGSSAPFTGGQRIDTVNTTGHLNATIPNATTESWTFTTSTVDHRQLNVQRRYAGNDNNWINDSFIAVRQC
jgi:hypothetical protein